MRTADAPRPGWYPDPEGGIRLRWWDGTDWADRYRRRPHGWTPSSPDAQVSGSAELLASSARATARAAMGQASGVAGADPQAIAEQVRRVVQEETRRASADFGQQARSASQAVVPLVTEYTSRIVRVIRRVSILVVVVLVLLVVLQAAAQEGLLDWIGDRIDNIGDDDSP